jgi:hypothetical protein
MTDDRKLVEDFIDWLKTRGSCIAHQYKIYNMPGKHTSTVTTRANDLGGLVDEFFKDKDDG